MTAPSLWITPLDLALLRAIDRAGSVVGACRRLGIPRDRGVYRIVRLERRLGVPAVRSRRGGRDRGASELTDAARQLLAAGPETHAIRPSGSVPLVGTYRHRPEGHVRVGARRVYVDFVAAEGERVGLAVDPEAVVVAPGRFASSARNVWPGVVRSVSRESGGPGPARCEARIRVLGGEVPVALTPASVDRLAIRRGRRVYLYVKATALRRAVTP